MPQNTSEGKCNRQLPRAGPSIQPRKLHKDSPFFRVLAARSFPALEPLPSMVTSRAPASAPCISLRRSSSLSATLRPAHSSECTRRAPCVHSVGQVFVKITHCRDNRNSYAALCTWVGDAREQEPCTCWQKHQQAPERYVRAITRTRGWVIGIIYPMLPSLLVMKGLQPQCQVAVRCSTRAPADVPASPVTLSQCPLPALGEPP